MNISYINNNEILNYCDQNAHFGYILDSKQYYILYADLLNNQLIFHRKYSNIRTIQYKNYKQIATNTLYKLRYVL